jgi:hypothetical protein
VVIEVARRFGPLPGVESRGRNTEHAEHRSQPQRWLGLFDSTKQSRLRLTVGKTTPRQIHLERPQKGHEEPDDRTVLLDPPSQAGDLCLKVLRVLGQYIEGNRRATGLPKPARRGRSRNTEAGGQGHVAGASDEVT